MSDVDKKGEDLLFRAWRVLGMDDAYEKHMLWKYGDPRPTVFHTIKFWDHDAGVWVIHD